MKKTLTDYLPQQNENKTRTIQAKVPYVLAQKARKKLNDSKLNWNQLVTAAVKEFLNEKPVSRSQ